MKCIVKEIDFLDADQFDNSYPFCDDPIRLHAQVIIGRDDQDGGDIFNLHVCNSAWLRHTLEREGVLIPSRIIFTEKFDESSLLDKVNSFVSRTEGDSVDEIFSKLHFFGAWEFL